MPGIGNLIGGAAGLGLGGTIGGAVGSQVGGWVEGQIGGSSSGWSAIHNAYNQLPDWVKSRISWDEIRSIPNRPAARWLVREWLPQYATIWGVDLQAATSYLDEIRRTGAGIRNDFGNRDRAIRLLELAISSMQSNQGGQGNIPSAGSGGTSMAGVIPSAGAGNLMPSLPVQPNIKNFLIIGLVIAAIIFLAKK